MRVYKTKIKGLILFKPHIFKDHRGSFTEIFNKKLTFNLGIKENFVQDNISYSKKNVLRGLHFQKINPQGKLINVVSGAIFDVVVDLRNKSKTFGKYETFKLNDKNFKKLWIPKGFAHGFLTLQNNTIVNYKVTDFFDPKDQNTIIWNDKSLKIKWPSKKPILSDKDKKGVFFKDL